jgi:hypothetical protein
MYTSFSLPSDALNLTARIAGAAILVSSLEYLAHRRILADEGLMSWEVTRHRRPCFISDGTGRFLDRLLAYPNVLGVLTIQSSLALGVCLTARPYTDLPVLLLGMTALAGLLAIRTPQGQDGADQMGLIMLTALSAGVMLKSPLLDAVVMGFIAFQVLLSYFTAGSAKAMSPAWRRGTALRDILQGRTYGSVALGRLAGWFPGLCRFVSWSVIAVECTLPLIAFAGPYGRIGFVVIGIALHGSIAVLMGLNTFLIMFLATYPCVIGLSAMVW